MITGDLYTEGIIKDSYLEEMKAQIGARWAMRLGGCFFDKQGAIDAAAMKGLVNG